MIPNKQYRLDVVLQPDFIYVVAQCQLTDAMKLNACMIRNKTYVVCRHMICDAWNEMCNVKLGQFNEWNEINEITKPILR